MPKKKRQKGEGKKMLSEEQFAGGVTVKSPSTRRKSRPVREARTGYEKCRTPTTWRSGPGRYCGAEKADGELKKKILGGLRGVFGNPRLRGRLGVPLYTLFRKGGRRGNQTHL